MNLVTGLADTVERRSRRARSCSRALEFNKGKRYADFNASPPTTSPSTASRRWWAAWPRRSSGFFALAAAFFAKFAKVIILGVAGARSRRSNSSKRKPKRHRTCRRRAPSAPRLMLTSCCCCCSRPASSARSRSPAARCCCRCSPMRSSSAGGMRWASCVLHLRARDGPLHRGAPARPRRGRADLHSLRRRVDRDEGHAARCRDRGLRRRRAVRCWAPRRPLACYFFARATTADLLLALSYAGFFLNLFNLIPLSPFDGGRITAIISPRVWLVGVPILVALFFWRPSPMLILMALLAAPQVLKAFRLPQGTREVQLLQREPGDQAHLWRPIPRAGRVPRRDVARRARDAAVDGRRARRVVTTQPELVVAHLSGRPPASPSRASAPCPINSSTKRPHHSRGGVPPPEEPPRREQERRGCGPSEQRFVADALLLHHVVLDHHLDGVPRVALGALPEPSSASGSAPARPRFGERRAVAGDHHAHRQALDRIDTAPYRRTPVRRRSRETPRRSRFPTARGRVRTPCCASNNINENGSCPGAATHPSGDRRQRVRPGDNVSRA